MKKNKSLLLPKIMMIPNLKTKNLFKNLLFI